MMLSGRRFNRGLSRFFCGDIILSGPKGGRKTMDRKQLSRINEEIEGFRKALVRYAQACEWDTFEKKAGILFDYLESIERATLEKKFFRVFLAILAVVAAVVSLVQLDGYVFPALLR